MTSSDVDSFWDVYCLSLPQEERDRQYYEAFIFGSIQTANKLAGLVLAGVKTATSELLWNLESEGKPLWHVGDESIVLDGSNNPVCVIVTTELTVKPFNEVDEEFARDYGEGDRTLEWWKEYIWEDYVKQCESLGRQATPDMLLVFERFIVTYIPS